MKNIKILTQSKQCSLKTKVCIAITIIGIALISIRGINNVNYNNSNISKSSVDKYMQVFSTYETQYGVTIASSLNVRSGAGTNYTKLGSIKSGSRISVTGKINNFYKITYSGKTGYISAQYVKITAKPVVVPYETQYGVTIASSLSVRSGAGTNYSRLGSIKSGSKISIIGKINNFYKITYSGKTGYISAQYVKITAKPVVVDLSILKFENENNTDFSKIKYIKSETKKDKKLEDAFAKVYDLKRDVDEVRYYYNRIDLNGDGETEIFVLLVGSSVCGTGGCSALIFGTKDNNYKLVSRFTLVNNPIIVSKNKTDGWNSLIMKVSGGGIKKHYAEMKYKDNKYPLNPSTQLEVKAGTKIEGTGIISDDISKSPGIKF